MLLQAQNTVGLAPARNNLVMYETADAASIVFATADIEAARARRNAENLKMGMDDAHTIEGWGDGFEEGIEVV